MNIFQKIGSQEAHWAVHYEGWTPTNLTKLLKNLGFEILQVKNNYWKGTYNFEVIARRNDIDLSKIDFENKVKDFLSDYLVDSSPGELKLLSVWMAEYKIQVSKCEQND